ncbi:MAG: enoyl-CoA hydratase/isomerase family protein [Pseudomonadota bacterium]
MSQQLPDRQIVSHEPLSIAELQILSQSPLAQQDLGPLGRQPYLQFYSAGLDALAVSELDALCDGLVNVPCPVIALGRRALPPQLADCVDIVLDGDKVDHQLLENIRRAPRAAMTLVQLLRHNAKVTPTQGLIAESLAYATLQSGPEFAAALPTLAKEGALQQDDGPPILLERQDNRLSIRLNRPATRNAYNADMRDALYEALLLIEQDTRIVTAEISGSGACFSVGGDLREFGSVADPATAHAIRSQRNVGQRMLAVSDRLCCRVHSACLGAGVELPSFAARIVAAPGAFFQLPEIQFGLLPGAGGSVSIPRRIGRHRTAWFALTARRVRAQTALEWGLIDAIDARAEHEH